MRLGLNNKVFLVTAASGGLGLATARALVDEGAGVLLTSRSQERLDRAVSILGGTQQAIGLAADLSDPHAADLAVKAALDSFGRIDGAFVSAGGPPKGHVAEVSDEQWRASFDSVFLGAMRVVRAIVAVNRAATLGFVLSTSVKVPLTNMALSNGLRPGLGMLVKQLADEIGPDGGRAFGMMPGSIATQRLIDLNKGTPDPDAARAASEAAIPLRRFGQPEEFGRVAAFLMSEAASYVTGCVIPVDGGSLRSL
ncbi:SDR family oxidoreductase [Brooklawnia cerclae]|uniref:3-oxoacyl-[acyl-carrier protein] reductase n=1 Tax=Brooklawnia cerclae TaxID=349934 RepID=A0ABX0SJG8_9ACTN|nr:SDR family oxidoreductase [Brooklawnia cerclae]NIH57458.1 3-oxoacyl-[acyl-carrier protein] reductase [Brooklawnia cerclae]